MKSHYVTGGTMLVSDASYVIRDADYLLRDRLVDGDFCYVLTPRQMGKSSLMVQTAHALRDKGIASVTLDLSKHGFTLDAGQWYDGLLEMIGYGLGLEDEIEELININSNISPLQRWQKAIRDVVLKRIKGPVVLFLDEIDIIRRFKFETDEFFAAIRACYSQRAEDPAYKRLTFCLIGVATPADLIQDPMLTPFNIGTRINLTDFTRQEASQLRLWLGKGETINSGLMERIYYWTNGHPYLTQRLCKAVAEDASIVSTNGVDQCCRSMFFAAKSSTIDDNLAFIRNWMIPEDDEQRIQLLLLYGKVLAGKRVDDSEADANVARLKLCGAVSNVNGRLATRNRIYSTAFDAAWVKDNMPGQELIRQRKAYIAGVLRVLVPAIVVAAIIGGLAVSAVQSARRAVNAEVRTRRLLYDMDMYQAGESWENGATALTNQLLDYHKQEPHEFAWNYINTQLNGELHRINSSSMVLHIAFSPNGRLLAAGYLDGYVRMWDSATYKLVRTLPVTGAVVWIAFSPNGQTLAAASSNAAVSVWGVGTGDRLTTFKTGATDSNSGATCVAFSPVDPNLLVAGDSVGNIWVLNNTHSQPRIAPREPYFNIHGLAFSPNGERLVITGTGSTLNGKLVAYRSDLPAYSTGVGILESWSTRSWTRTARVSSAPMLNSTAFSPNGKLIAITRWDGGVGLWDPITLKPIHSFSPFMDQADGVSFSHDGKRLAAASWDNTIHVWNVKDYGLEEEIKGCVDRATSVAFAGNDRALITGDAAGDIKVWNVGDSYRKPTEAFVDPVRNVAISPKDPLVAVALNDQIAIWNSRTQEKADTVLRPEPGHTIGIVFSSDGKYLFSNVSQTHEIGRWDVNKRRAILPGFKCRRQATTSGMTLSPDGTLLAAATSGSLGDSPGSVLVWNVATCAVLTEITTKSSPTSMAFSPDGNRIAASELNNTTHVWDARSGRLLATLPSVQRNTIVSVAWSPDGNSIATACWDKTVCLWDAATYKSYALLRGHNAAVLTCCFTGDSHYLITAGEDRLIKYWDVKLAREDREMAREVLTLKGHTEPVRHIVISNDSRLLISQDQHTVRFWRADEPK